MDLALVGDAEQPKAKPPAQVTKTRVAFAPLAARREASREPDLVASRRAVDALQQQLQIEGELQLADDDDRSVVRAKRDEVAMADFPISGKTEAFEEALDGKIERGFQGRSPGATGAWAAKLTSDNVR